MNTETEEKDWLKRLQEEDEQALQLIFDRYYKYLVVTAYNVVNDDHKARDIVQDVFFGLWKKRAGLNINISLKAYLRRATVNRSIDILRSRKKFVWNEAITDYDQPSKDISAQQHLEKEDLQTIINAAIESLPERCRQVFSLSRFEDLSHKEISEKLGISVKTIENQMTKALKVLRAAVEQYGVWWLILVNYVN